MDKTRKLQRYHRKDYSEVVDFPVEIVGRDGVVRRYTFEDSIRLYQRRITFAPIRYTDSDLAGAEVNHCRSRIDQLRRSYFHRFGWGTPDGQPEPADVFAGIAGEVAAFLCRVLAVDGRPAVRFDVVEPEGGSPEGQSLWFVTPDSGDPGMLLYVHHFVDEAADAHRERFFSRLKGLERHGHCAGDGERLLAFHHAVDCGFVLTGRAAEFPGALPVREPVALNEPPTDPTPWDEIVQRVRRGHAEEALAMCADLLEDHPWHRRAYVGGAILGLQLGQSEVAEGIAALGHRYFPEDGVLAMVLGASRLKSSPADARVLLSLAAGSVPDASLLLASDALRKGNRQASLHHLDRATGLDPLVDAVRTRIQTALRWRPVVDALALALAGLGTLFLSVSWLGALALLLGLTGGAVWRLALRQGGAWLRVAMRAESPRRTFERLVRTGSDHRPN